VDHDTLQDGCVTVRYRDTMAQDRIKIEDLHELIRKATDPKELYRKIVGDSLEDTNE
jgi:glycyl-tRNA synthetase